MTRRILTLAERQEMLAVTKERDKFSFELGEFVLNWSDTEAELYAVLTYYAGVSDGVARAIFSGARAKTMSDFLRAIIHNTTIDAARKNDLEFVLPHVIAINTIRDHIVHHSSWKLFGYDEPATRYIHNIGRVSRYGNHFVEQIGSKTLQDINSDLRLIQSHLNRHVHVPDDPVSGWLPRDKYRGEKTTWLYKPAQPKKKNPGREHSPRKQQPPR